MCVGRGASLLACSVDKGALLLTGMCIEMFQCRIVLEFLDEILVFFIIVCGMVIISYKIFVCMDILGASCSGAFSIWSYCRVCENPFYGVFMFG